MSDSLVIIPTFNEKENIANIIDAVFNLEKDDFHILIVDDGSPDGTADIVKTLIPKHNGKLHIEERSGKLGLGTAYIHGFKWALQRSYEYIFEMDADFSHNPKDLVRLYEACIKPNIDLAIGSRYVKGGGVENWPQNRKLLSRFASIYVQLITWLPVKDTTAGFVCYSRKLLSEIDFNKIEFVGYAFQIQMKFATWHMGYKIVEVPIIFKDRELGQSKMSSSIISEAVIGVIKMKLKSFSSGYKK